MTKLVTLTTGFVALALFTGATCSSQHGDFDPEATAKARSEARRMGLPPQLPAEPRIPPACATLNADKTPVNGFLAAADETRPDTDRIQAALNACDPGHSVKLQASGTATGFLSGPLDLPNGVTLWIDTNTTLYASRDPRDYDTQPGACGTHANNNSGGCRALINVNKVANVGVMGDGAIDGRGGEPMIGDTQTWWDVAQDAKVKKKSHSNPRLIDVKKTNNFTLYKIKLYNSPKFHVGLNANGYVAWGVTILTPSRSKNSQGRPLTPYYARNTDGIDPSAANDGVIAYCNISTGDDQIAIKGGNQGPTSGLLIAHNHFGTGHGMSIGSETNGGVSAVTVYDLSIDGSIPTGGAPPVDLNGIRIKSDPSRGGPVTDITYTDVCMRDLANPIVITPHYSKATGGLIPEYSNVVLNDVRMLHEDPDVRPVITLMGFDVDHLMEATLNNVIVDGIEQGQVKAAFTDLTLGTGPVNFAPSGDHVDVIRDVTAQVAPNPCPPSRFIRFEAL